MRILLTRPQEWGKSLYNQLKARGHQVDWIPLIHYQPPSDFSLEEACCQLPHSHIAIFISQAAVCFSKPIVEAIQPDWPAIQWLAIGESTAQALKKMGIPQVLTSPSAPYDSESLLKLPVLQSIQGKTITILKGEGGRALLDQTLQSREAKVYNLNLYKRTLPEIDKRTNQYLARWAQDTFIPDLSIVTSAEALNNYKIIFANHLPLLQKKPLIVVGKRLWTIAQELGFEKPLLALGADDQNLLEVMIDYANSKRLSNEPAGL